MNKSCLFAGILLSLTCAYAEVEESGIIIPQKPDPPFALDGDLSDWQRVPNKISLGTKAFVTFNPERWDGAKDLSADVQFAWREGVIYISANISDNLIRQTSVGGDMWRGDHVEVFLDFNPDLDADRESFGPGQWHIGLSPGKQLNDTQSSPGEAYVFRPEGFQLRGAQVACRRIDNGYILEAAIPTAQLGLPEMSQNVRFSAELGISDCDSQEPMQEKMMTLSSRPWSLSRKRLNPFIFGNAAGEATVGPTKIILKKTMTLQSETSESVTFERPSIPKGKEAALFLRGRIPYAKPAGYRPNALTLILNGKTIDSKQLTNRPVSSKRLSGESVTSVNSAGQITLSYSPDFTTVDSDPEYGLVGVKDCEFEFQITDFLNEGNNVLELHNNLQSGAPDGTIAVADVELLIKAPAPPKPTPKPAPTGALPTIVPESDFSKSYTAREDQPLGVKVQTGGEAFLVSSRFSTPDGKWNTGRSALYAHSRKIRYEQEAIVVQDTFKNRTDQDIPIIQSHEVAIPGNNPKAWLGGLLVQGGSGSRHDPENPTSYAENSDAGIGMLPLSDAFRVHSKNAWDGQVLSLTDDMFVLAPKTTYIAEWAIIPQRSASFWGFINSTRRLLDVNFPLKAQFAFLRLDPKPVYPDWPDSLVQDFLKFKGADVVTLYNFYKGKYRFGTAFQKEIDFQDFRSHNEELNRLAPNVIPLVYYHCYLDSSDSASEEFSKDAMLDSDGKTINYGGVHSYMHAFIPTLENGFGKASAKNIDLIFDQSGAKGVYWDEMERTVGEFHYGEPWDGVSGDIDTSTFKLIRKKSSVPLLSQPFRIFHVRRIQEKGFLIANAMPYTRTIGDLKFQRFVETGSISNCAKAILYTPVALGDHLSETNEADAYSVMLKALDYGCLYNWYGDDIIPTHKTLASYMFPITPVQLGPGFIIGKERIVTKESGLYGWNDDSEHEVRIFDATGLPREDFNAPLVKGVNNTTLTELRLAEGWSAVIIRKN